MRLALAILMLVVGVQAATFTSPTANLSDVSATISNPSVVDGDTVNIPAGNVSWGSTLTITKGIILSGAGTNSTIINGNAITLITWAVPAGKNWRMTGITFDGVGSQSWNGFLRMGAGPKAFRMDHCLLRNMGGWCVVIDNDLFGVIDHCYVLNYSAAFTIGNGGESNLGDASWASDTNFGTTNALYVEDCYFGGTSAYNGAMDGNCGGRWVFRHNTVVNDLLVAHGTENNGGSPRGTRAVEVYLNNMSSAGFECACEFRSGTGVIWSNTISGYGFMVKLKDFRQFYSNLGCSVPSSGCFNYAPWYATTGSNPWDGNTGTPGTDAVAYPALDQPGRGKSDVINRASPAWPHNLSEPFYSWGNLQGGSSIGIDCAWSCDLIHEGRDYTNNTQLPGYTPLVYPHPLVSGGGGGGGPAITINPSPVTNFSGTALFLSVSASGSATLTYRWRQNTNTVSGQTSSTFTSNSVQTTSSGWYDCVVTNGSGSVTSSVVYVQITNAAPSIVTQPTGQTISVGDTISLSTVASGSLPLSYQWRKNAVAISGATSTSYTTNNAQTNLTGAYTCVVTNLYGIITTSVATVTVQLDLAPHVSNSWSNQALAFNSYTTTVAVSGSKPMLVAFVHSYSSGGNKVTNVTFNSVNLTRLFRTNYYSANGALDIWFLANPTPATANLIISGTAVAESTVIAVLATNAPTSWALFEPPQGNYYAFPVTVGTETINQPSQINELVLDAMVCASFSYNPQTPQTLLNRVVQSTQTVLQASWNRSLGVYTPMVWTPVNAVQDTATHVSVAIAQALPTALPTKLTISNIRVSGRVTIP